MTMVLIEHARSTIMYEKQHLRELESLRPDFVNAARKAVAPPPVQPPPARPLTPPRVPPPPTNTPVVSPPPVAAARPGPPVIKNIPAPSPVRPLSASAQGPLGGGPSASRHMDASKSMFITPTTPSAATVNPLAGPPPPPGASNAISDPLLSPAPQAHTLGRSNGMMMGHPLAASVTPAAHRRLDAREAAAKLANFL